MAFSFSERLQIVYSDNSSKYNIEKEEKDEQLEIGGERRYGSFVATVLMISHQATNIYFISWWPIESIYVHSENIAIRHDGIALVDIEYYAG